MRYQNVCLEAFGYVLPDEVLTTAQIETQLEPLYARLKLPGGRLELMTGIRERRLWPRGMRPSDPSIQSARHCLEQADFDPQLVGTLVHGSVCRDQLEPATACRVHHALGLSEFCQAYDVSNACLGLLSGIVQVANQIELGQIRAGLVVGTEDSRPLLEATIRTLNEQTGLDRNQIKPAIASLTIGSGSAAVLLVHRDISRTGHVLRAAVQRAQTQHHALCCGDQAEHGLLMQTDSEQLLQAGVAAAQPVLDVLLNECGWSRQALHKSISHQVGSAHQKAIYAALGLGVERDFATVSWLGNTGSVALPLTAALAAERGHLQPDDHVAWLGIGSGVNVLMLGWEWGTLAPRIVRRERQIAADVIANLPPRRRGAAAAR